MGRLRGTCWIWGTSVPVRAEEELNAQWTRYTRKCVVRGEARTLLPKDGQHRGARVGGWAGKIREVCQDDQPVLVCLALSHLNTKSPECQRPFSPGRFVSIVKRLGCVWFPKSQGKQSSRETDRQHQTQERENLRSAYRIWQLGSHWGQIKESCDVKMWVLGLTFWAMGSYHGHFLQQGND